MKEYETDIIEIKDDIKKINIKHNLKEVIKYNIDLIFMLVILTIVFIIISTIGKYFVKNIFISVVEILLAICAWICMYVYSLKSIKFTEFNRGHIKIFVYLAPMLYLLDSIAYLPVNGVVNEEGHVIIILLIFVISIFATICLSMKSIFCVYIKDNKLYIRTVCHRVRMNLSDIIKVYTNTKFFANTSQKSMASRRTYFNVIYKNEKGKIRKLKKCVKVEYGRTSRNLKTGSVIIRGKDINSIKNCFITTKDKDNKI